MSMPRSLVAVAVAVALPLCLAPAAPAASKSLTLPVPNASDVTVAHVAFTVAGRTRGKPPAPKVVGARSLGSALTVVGGLGRTARPRTLLASLVVARRAGGEAGVSGVTVQVRLPRGALFGRFVRRHVERSVDAAVGTAKYCASLPRSFAYVAAKPLAGRALSGMNGPAVVKAASSLGCGRSPQRAALLGALGVDESEGGGSGDEAGSGSGAAPPGCTEDGGAACGDEDYSPAVSSTLTATGSVTRDPADPRRFTYSITFNEAVTAFELSARPASIRCPASAYADWIGTCPPESLNPGHGLKCEQPPGSYTYQFVCSTPSPDRGGSSSPPVPAGAAIDGAFTTEPSAPAPSFTSVEVVGVQEGRGSTGTRSRPQTIPVS